jgi:hypothetical protein
MGRTTQAEQLQAASLPLQQAPPPQSATLRGLGRSMPQVFRSVSIIVSPCAKA